MSPYPPPMAGVPEKKKTLLPLAGGALLVVAGLMGIAFWAFVITTTSGFTSMLPVGGDAVQGIINICGAIEIIFGIIALLGGVMGLMRRMWGIALVGGILGLFTIGWFFLGSVLSLVGLILIAVSHGEFS